MRNRVPFPPNPFHLRSRKTLTKALTISKSLTRSLRQLYPRRAETYPLITVTASRRRPYLETVYRKITENISRPRSKTSPPTLLFPPRVSPTFPGSRSTNGGRSSAHVSALVHGKSRRQGRIHDLNFLGRSVRHPSGFTYDYAIRYHACDNPAPPPPSLSTRVYRSAGVAFAV